MSGSSFFGAQFWNAKYWAAGFFRAPVSSGPTSYAYDGSGGAVGTGVAQTARHAGRRTGAGGRRPVIVAPGHLQRQYRVLSIIRMVARGAASIATGARMGGRVAVSVSGTSSVEKTHAYKGLGVIRATGAAAVACSRQAETGTEVILARASARTIRARVVATTLALCCRGASMPALGRLAASLGVFRAGGVATAARTRAWRADVLVAAKGAASVQVANASVSTGMIQARGAASLAVGHAPAVRGSIGVAGNARAAVGFTVLGAARIEVDGRSEARVRHAPLHEYVVYGRGQSAVRGMAETSSTPSDGDLAFLFADIAAFLAEDDDTLVFALAAGTAGLNRRTPTGAGGNRAN